MPIYEYQCKACGHELEKIQRMNDPVLIDCPACEQPQLKKLISAAAFRLKGSGWYETDFKQDKKRNLAGDDNSNSSSKPDAPKTGDKKTESNNSEKVEKNTPKAESKSTTSDTKKKLSKDK